METQDEGVVPFVREMLRQRPTRHMIKIYAIGSTLAALGAVVGLMQWVFRPEEPEEEEAAGPTGESARRAEASARGPKASARGAEAPTAETTVQTADELWAETRPTANRLHAS